MLVKKLAIKSQSECLIINPSPHQIQELDFIETTTQTNPNWILIIASNLEELTSALSQNQTLFKAAEIIWIAYPKLSSPLKSDINRDSIWKLILQFGLTPNSQIALNEIWSAVRFKNGDAPRDWVDQYLDPQARKQQLANRPEITVPEELLVHFNQNPEAENFYHSLSYTCRKEYAKYVAEAKKPETRIARALKTIQALINKQKQF